MYKERTAMKKHIILAAIVALLIPTLSFAAFYADTDGDGYTDQVYACGSPVQVCIYHPRTGVTTMYRNGAASSFSINSVVDTDGVAGAEVVVVWTSTYGNPKGIDVIRDRNRTTTTYDYTNNPSFSINSVVDTDGNVGGEIVVLWTYAGGPNHGLDVIHDALRTKYTYDYSTASSFSINSVVDTDNTAGGEIIVIYTTTWGERGIHAIHDRTRTRNVYLYTYKGTFEIASVSDTDGIGGMEIIVKYPTGTYSTGATKGIDVIHDINRTTNIYDFTSQYFSAYKQSEMRWYLRQRDLQLLGKIPKLRVQADYRQDKELSGSRQLQLTAIRMETIDISRNK